MMNDAVITFDFHNTLVRADAWFELEVRDLVTAFLAWRARESGVRLLPQTKEDARQAYRQLRARIIADGRELSAERCVEVVLSELGLSAPSLTIERGVHALMRETLVGARLLPGAAETIGGLFEMGIPLGIVSSAVYHPFLEWTLERFNLRASFRFVATSASIGFYKSHPEIYRQTLAALGATPEMSVHIGDSHRFDVETANRIGMRTVWISDGPPPLGEQVADLILPDLVGSASRIGDLLARPPSASRC